MPKTGSMSLGVFIGFILMVIIGWIPVLGALVAGIIAGAIARGPGRGIATGFFAGILGLIILAIFFFGFGSTNTGTLGTQISSVVGLSIHTLLVVLSVGGIILITIGGLIGGALAPQETALKTIVRKEETVVHHTTDKNEIDEKKQDPLHILKQRYAKGEITKRQYEQMKKELEETD